MPAAKASSESAALSVLELDLQYEPVLTQEVKQSRTVTFSRQQKMSVYGKRILARVMEQITDDDLQLREFYQFRVSSLLTDTKKDGSNAYKEIKPALRELSRTSWEFEDKEAQDWKAYPLLSGIGLKDGIVSISLNSRLAPFFIKIAGQYSLYKLDAYMGLNSWYSMRFYEILSTYRDTGWWQVSLEDYRLYMDCGPDLDKAGKPKRNKAGNLVMKLPDTTHLITNTVVHSQAELAHSPCAFSYEPVYEEGRMSRGRRKIVGLRFTLLEKEPTAIPPSWMEHKPTAALIARLRGWRVTDKNIIHYLKPIGTVAAQALVYEWQLKENSQKKIDDRVKYCNAVFVRAGKAAILAARDKALQQNIEDQNERVIAKQALLGFMH